MPQDYSELATLANATGRAFEREIIEACDRYREEALADINRCRPAARSTPLSTRLPGVSEVDFDGDLITDHRRIAFDTKSISKNSTYYHAPRDRHQLAFLMRLQAKGHIGFILLHDHHLDMAWLLMDLRRLLEPPEYVYVRTIQNGTLSSYLPRVERKDGVWDFLPVALAEYDRLAARSV